MSSEVETPLEISGSRKIQRFLDSARNDNAQQVTRALFAHLTVCHDEVPHSAAMNMAIDETLLETAAVPTIRFYRWRSPALSFGYFGKFSDVAIYAAERDLVRRWTGGGIVFHGGDLTYSIVIPASDAAFRESSMSIYENVHHALRDALIANGKHAKLSPADALYGGRQSRKADLQIAPAVADRCSSNNDCFANPVRADVMIDGRKIAGAAQRRTRRGLLQQGSVQGFTMKTDLAQKFVQALSANCSEFEFNEEIFRRARGLAQEKYGTESWLKKR
jgi:lipoyl(octanoyl) transferase